MGEIGEEIGVEEGLMIVTVMLKEVLLVEIGMGHLVEEETTAVEEMTVVLPIGGLDRENLIETISLRWEIVTAAMIVGVAVRLETAGDQDLEWVTEIKEVQEAVVLQQRISQEVVTNQQMGKTENGKLSANVNESFYFHRKCNSNL